MGQEIVFHELLGQRAAALNGFPGPQVGQDRPRDAANIDARMEFEITVLDCLQAGDEQGRNIRDPDQGPILFLQRVDAGDFSRIKPCQVNGSAPARVAERADFSTGNPDADAAGLFGAVMEPERPSMDIDGVARNSVLSRQGRIACGPVAGRLQLHFEIAQRDRGARVQFQGARVDAAWQVPFPAFEFRGDLVVQVGGPGHEQAKQNTGHQKAEPPQPADPAALRRPCRPLLFSCFRLFAFRHPGGCLSSG